MSLLQMCFGGATGYAELSIDGIGQSNRKWVPLDELAKQNYDIPVAANHPELYFGPACRSVSGKMGKANCRGSWVCWIDADEPGLPDSTIVIMPTAIVRSGGGHHLYWRLNEFCTNPRAIEDVNKSLATTMGGDSAYNIDRMLRVPDSWNHKYNPPKQVELMHYDESLVYSLDQLSVLGALERKSIHKIITGDRRGYKSRSERDMAIVRALISAGADDGLIIDIFKRCKCGDKFLEEGIKGFMYLERTITNARETVNPGDGNKKGFVESSNCYFMPTSRGRIQLSTFILEPTLLLEGEDEDSLVCNVRACGTEHVWQDVVLPRGAFDSVRNLNQHLSKAAWVWLGRDNDVRQLLAYLITQLQDKGVPRAIATTVLGRHHIPRDPRSFFVADEDVLASDGSIWSKPSEAPIMYVDTGRECPKMKLSGSGIGESDIDALASLLPRLNDPECIWPMIGWFMACPYKPEIERLGYRFPILNVTGTKGSGKTTLVTQVFQPILGYAHPRSYDVGTTHFVTLSLLGSSNAVPIAFSEYRAATGSDFTRHVLLAYDTGRDARGNPNQTTTQYPLIAPFSMDGEDKLEDPAAMERMIVVVLSPQTIQEGSDCWLAFQDIRALTLRNFALPYLMHTLESDVALLLDMAEEHINEAFPQILPDRVRRNLTVGWVGVLSFMEFLSNYGVDCYPKDGPSVMRQALLNVYSVARGRAPIAADSFAEFVVNGAAQKSRRFPWHLDNTTGILWFQLLPAYETYTSFKARQRRDVLSKNALRIQLAELENEYMASPRVMELQGRSVFAFGIDLARAYKMGLDIPESFTSKSITFQFG